MSANVHEMKSFVKYGSLTDIDRPRAVFNLLQNESHLVSLLFNM